jgi:hypothetical protein
MRRFLNLDPKTLNPKPWELLNLTLMPTCFSPIHSWLCLHHKKACFAEWPPRQHKNPSYEQKIAECKSIQWVGMCFCEHSILLLSALEWSDPQQQWPHTEMFLQNKTCANTSLHLLGVQKWQRIQTWWTSWQWISLILLFLASLVLGVWLSLSNQRKAVVKHFNS